jgi:hypothetical protein
MLDGAMDLLLRPFNQTKVTIWPYWSSRKIDGFAPALRVGRAVWQGETAKPYRSECENLNVAVTLRSGAIGFEIEKSTSRSLLGPSTGVQKPTGPFGLVSLAG